MRFVLDKDGNRVFIENTFVKQDYFCPTCGETLVLKKAKCEPIILHIPLILNAWILSITICQIGICAGKIVSLWTRRKSLKKKAGKDSDALFERLTLS